MIKEFTVIKPKSKKVLVLNSKLKDGGGNSQFKDVPINTGDDVLYDKISSIINVLSSSWTANSEITIITDSTKAQIKDCMKKCRLKITAHRKDLIDKKIKNSEFTLTVLEKNEINNYIIKEPKIETKDDK